MCPEETHFLAFSQNKVSDKKNKAVVFQNVKYTNQKLQIEFLMNEFDLIFVDELELQNEKCQL